MRNDDGDFDQRFERAKGDAAAAAEGGFSTLSAKLHELVTMQAAEIARLRAIIADGTTIPERHAVHASLSTYTRDNREWRDVVALDSAHTLWLLPNAPTHSGVVSRHAGWVRLPPLPQGADEMEPPA